jgi:hypothetical protein
MIAVRDELTAPFNLQIAIQRFNLSAEETRISWSKWERQIPLDWLLSWNLPSTLPLRISGCHRTFASRTHP